MKRPDFARLQDHAEKAYQRLEKNLDKVRRLIPANDDLAETQFLPAALELIETPPSPVGRGLAYAICSIFVIALLWSIIGKVDLIATAPGKIIPGGKVKLIQPLEIGVVSKIDVTEGQKVKAGDVLVEIDPTESRAEAQRLAQELVRNQVEAARLEATASADPSDIDSINDAELSFLDAVPTQADPDLVEKQRVLLRSALSQQAATLAGIDSDIAKLNQTLPLMRKRAQMRKQLIKQGYSSKMDESREEQNLIENEQALVQDNQKRAEAAAKFSASTLTELAQAEGKAKDAQQQLVKAQDLASHRTLAAPVDGTVQQLAIHTVGGVVTPAQELMVVVPEGARLEIEASIKNGDIGFVREGQAAEVKLKTFPFTRYGLLHGTVLNVSRDAVQTPPTKAKADATPENESASSPVPESSTYTARISLDRDTMNVDGRDVPLGPGMEVTAEIRTGRQRIIDYLLDPLRRYRHDAFQER
jgi:hemolysin D